MTTTDTTTAPVTGEVDAVVIGAGFAGIYMNYRLRDQMGLDVQVFEAGDDVGGTWYWNRYPGARCDSESYIYCYSFDKDLMQEWEWSGKYPEQPEILRYLNHVADRFDIRRNIKFETRVTGAHWDEHVEPLDRHHGPRRRGPRHATSSPPSAACRAARCRRSPASTRSRATGTTPAPGPTRASTSPASASASSAPGSSGVQSIPVIAKQAGHLTVFQRTPQYTVPARHGTVDKAFLDEIKTRYDEIYEMCRQSAGGQPYTLMERSALEVSDEERTAIYEAAWQEGGFKFMLSTFNDIALDRRANDTASRVHPQQDPRDGDGPGGRREARAGRPPVHVEAAADRHQLLRHVQPRQRHARRHPPRADRGDHGDRHPHGRGDVRPRHHRVRHRLRRDDRHVQPDGHPRPRRRAARRTSGRTGRRRTSAWRRRASRTCS